MRLPDGAISDSLEGVSTVFDCGSVALAVGGFALAVGGFALGVGGFALGVCFGLGGEFPRRRLPAGKMIGVSEVFWLFDGGFTSGGGTFTRLAGGCG